MSPLSDRQLVELKELAAKATPGPWRICLGSGGNLCTGVCSEDESGVVTHVADCLPDYALERKSAPDNHVPTMKYIEAVSPDVVLALLSELSALRADKERLEVELGWAKKNSQWKMCVAVMDTNERLEKALRLAATRLEILTGRMRACREETGQHELLSEAEAFCAEALEALPPADTARAGGR